MPVSTRVPWSLSNPAVWGFLLASLVPVLAHSADTAAPVIRHSPCVSYEVGAAIEIRVEIRDDSELYDPKVLHRPRGAKRWRASVLRPGLEPSIYIATFEAPARPVDVEYFVQSFDIDGNGPASFGTTTEPIRLVASEAPEPCVQVPLPMTAVVESERGPLDAPPRPIEEPSLDDVSFFENPIVWLVAGGVVAAAAAVGTIVALSRDDASPQALAERVRIQITTPPLPPP